MRRCIIVTIVAIVAGCALGPVPEQPPAPRVTAPATPNTPSSPIPSDIVLMRGALYDESGALIEQDGELEVVIQSGTTIHDEKSEKLRVQVRAGHYSFLVPASARTVLFWVQLGVAERPFLPRFRSVNVARRGGEVQVVNFGGPAAEDFSGPEFPIKVESPSPPPTEELVAALSAPSLPFRQVPFDLGRRTTPTLPDEQAYYYEGADVVKSQTELEDYLVRTGPFSSPSVAPVDFTEEQVVFYRACSLSGSVYEVVSVVEREADVKVNLVIWFPIRWAPVPECDPRGIAVAIGRTNKPITVLPIINGYYYQRPTPLPLPKY